MAIITNVLSRSHGRRKAIALRFGARPVDAAAADARPPASSTPQPAPRQSSCSSGPFSSGVPHPQSVMTGFVLIVRTYRPRIVLRYYCSPFSGSHSDRSRLLDNVLSVAAVTVVHPRPQASRRPISLPLS